MGFKSHPPVAWVDPLPLPPPKNPLLALLPAFVAEVAVEALLKLFTLLLYVLGLLYAPWREFW